MLNIDKGRLGEFKTSAIHKRLNPDIYRVYDNVFISTDSRSSQIDHVIVSKYGIFIVESKYMNGWIFGSSENEYWTEVLYPKKIRFQNPLRQNYYHINCLADVLQIDRHKIHSIIVFWGGCHFETRMPENVLFGNDSEYIKSKTQILFSDSEVKILGDRLLMLLYHTPPLARYRYAKSLKERFNRSTTCPKCGGKLVERISRKGKYIGQKFLGCDNFPQCYYKKEL